MKAFFARERGRCFWATKAAFGLSDSVNSSSRGLPAAIESIDETGTAGWAVCFGVHLAQSWARGAENSKYPHGFCSP